MTNFDEHVPIDDVTGSEYNPRAITPESLEALQRSIRRFGMVKPLIVNSSNNVITAGHQRKKAATAIGLLHLPCIKINSPNPQDEILFNLMHNSIETSGTEIHLGAFTVSAYSYCPADKIKINGKPENVLICSEISKMLSRYGEWGSVVTDGKGNVILNAEYAYCAKKLGYGVLSYAVPDEDVEEFLEAMGVEYGKYYFDEMGIKTYHQFEAQLFRLNTNGSFSRKSSLYEKQILPRVKKTDSIVDIGAGRLAYFNMLKSQGYDIHAYEPSLIAKGSNTLDMRGIIALILDYEKHVRKDGLFDVGILDSVINSVIDDEFEKAVMILCNISLKTTGVLYTATRMIDCLEQNYDIDTVKSGHIGLLMPIDDKGYSLSIKNGILYKQHHHTQESFVNLLSHYFEEVEVLLKDKTRIHCSCKRPKQLPTEVYEEYLEKELNIEYPNGFKHNKHKGLMNALIAKAGERYG
jgi:ParB family chromosome partitioning protein